MYSSQMDLAERLRVLRKHFKVSQSDLGDLLSVRQQAVSHYEKTGNIEASKLELLADHFNLDIKFFYDNAPIEHYDLNNKELLRPMSALGTDIPAGWGEIIDRINQLDRKSIKDIEKVIIPLIEIFEQKKH